MKKIISALLAVILLVCCIPFTSYAEETVTSISKTFTVSIEKATVKGGAVSITLDTDNLEITSGNWLIDNAQLKDFKTDKGQGVFVFTTATEISGNVFSFTVSPKSTATFGSYPISASVQLTDASGNINTISVSLGQIDVNYTYSSTPTSLTVKSSSVSEYSIDGTTWQTSGTFSGLYPNTSYTVSVRPAGGSAASAVFTVKTSESESYTKGEYIDSNASKNANVKFTHNVDFGNSLSLYYYVKQELVDGGSNVRLLVQRQKFNADGSEFTIQSKVINATVETTTGVPRYQFIFDGIASCEVGDEIYATLYYENGGVTYISPVDLYGVKTYAYNRLKNSTSDEFKTLLVDVLNYASQAQIYFNYNTSHLVNADLTNEQKAFGTVANPTAINYYSETEKSDATARFVAKNVGFEQSTILYYYFTIDSTVDLSKVKLVLKYTPVGALSERVVTISSFGYDEANSRYYAYLDDVAIVSIGCPISATIYENDIAISSTMVYNIETYAYNRIQKTQNETFKELLYTMLKYSRSATVYFS